MTEPLTKEQIDAATDEMERLIDEATDVVRRGGSVDDIIKKLMQVEKLALQLPRKNDA